MFVVLAVIEGCPVRWLDSRDAVGAALDAAVAAARFELLSRSVVSFSPQGVTAFAVVGESHVALHSWPEDRRLFVDVASCRSLESAREALEAVVAALPEGRLLSRDERVFDAAAAGWAPPPRDDTTGE